MVIIPKKERNLAYHMKHLDVLRVLRIKNPEKKIFPSLFKEIPVFLHLQQINIHAYIIDKDLQHESESMKQKEKSKHQYLSKFLVMMLGGETAWTVAVLNLLTFSDMRRGPLDGLQSYDQRQRWVDQQI
ncbi:hypothetical protein GQ457_17G007130 [Hibiscus cannabinus]